MPKCIAGYVSTMAKRVNDARCLQDFGCSQSYVSERPLKIIVRVLLGNPHRDQFGLRLGQVTKLRSMACRLNRFGSVDGSSRLWLVRFQDEDIPQGVSLCLVITWQRSTTSPTPWFTQALPSRIAFEELSIRGRTEDCLGSDSLQVTLKSLKPPLHANTSIGTKLQAMTAHL